ncbi:hypothetical protein Ocin01_08122, partial [Orchesella cincta]
IYQQLATCFPSVPDAGKAPAEASVNGTDNETDPEGRFLINWKFNVFDFAKNKGGTPDSQNFKGIPDSGEGHIGDSVRHSIFGCYLN